MGCLSITITPFPRPSLSLETQARARLTLHDGHGNPPRKTASLGLSPTPRPSLVLTALKRPSLSLASGPRATLVIGEVCSVGDGELLVLAGTDGPLRFKDGGYWLLDPEREDDDNSDDDLISLTY